MIRAIFSALAALLLMTGILAAQTAQPLQPDDAFSLAASRQGDDIHLHWSIAPGYYLYRDQFALEEGGAPVALDIPAGEIKDDENFGRVEVYHDALTLAAPVAGGPLVVHYQGCQEAGLCYARIAKQIDPDTLDITEYRAPDPYAASETEWAASGAELRFVPTSQSGDADTAGAAPVVTGSGATDTVSGLLDRGGYLWVAGGFLLFGLLLAFTPCVLPMYPILAATLAREGETLTRARGFALSLTYVVAMAFAFGILGVFAGLTGGNLQIALQSPWAVAAISALFVVLALSMFGLFELQLPASWVNRIGGAQTGRRGSYLAAGGMGFTSALIVGPCVTAPLAGALIYIARTGDMVLGALALFLLGLGQGIPLIAFGTFGASALPRRGAWMETVKLVFAFVFLAAAIWMVSRILPGPVGLALWAALAMGAAVALGGFDRPDAGAGKIAQTARAGGLIAALGAALLAVGAALGADDPLRPLAPLAKTGATQQAESLQFASAGSLEELRAGIGRGRPAMVYFTADWCTTCRHIERAILPRADLHAAASGYDLIKVDLTRLDDARRAMMAELDVIGPPTLIWFDPAGAERPGTRLVGEIEAEAMIARFAQGQTP